MLPVAAALLFHSGQKSNADRYLFRFGLESDADRYLRVFDKLLSLRGFETRRAENAEGCSDKNSAPSAPLRFYVTTTGASTEAIANQIQFLMKGLGR